VTTPETCAPRPIRNKASIVAIHNLRAGAPISSEEAANAIEALTREMEYFEDALRAFVEPMAEQMRATGDTALAETMLETTCTTPIDVTLYLRAPETPDPDGVRRKKPGMR